jgi:hypothetical protein
MSQYVISPVVSSNDDYKNYTWDGSDVVRYPNYPSLIAGGVKLDLNLQSREFYVNGAYIKTEISCYGALKLFAHSYLARTSYEVINPVRTIPLCLERAVFNKHRAQRIVFEYTPVDFINVGELERLVDPSTGNLYYKEGHLIDSNFPPRTLRIILLHVQGVYYPRIRWIGNTCEDGCNRNALKMNLGGISRNGRAYVDDEAFLYLTRSNIPIVTTKIFLDGCDRRDCCDEVIVVRRSAC